MSWSLRRAVFTALLIVALSSAAVLSKQIQVAVPAGVNKPAAAPVAGKNDAKDKDAKDGDKDDFSDSSAITLPKDTRLKAQVEAAVDNIRDKNWVVATEVLQKLVGIKEDVFAKLTKTTPEGKVVQVWASVRAEANRLIASLPPEGMEFYLQQYGPEAAKLLKEAKASNKPDLLASIMRLYLYTDAGAEATDLLGTYHLDRGNFSTASRCFSLLIGRSGIDKLSPATLFKAAYAFHQTGAAEDKVAEEQVWKQLTARAREVRLGGDDAWSVEDLRNYVTSVVRPGREVAASDWPLYRGNSTRSARGIGGYAFMDIRWKQSGFGPHSNPESGDTARWIQEAEKHLKRNNQPVLSSFFPVTATVTFKDSHSDHVEKKPVVFYRNNWGLNAVDMKTGKLCWQTQSNWSLDRMTESSNGTSQIIHQWMDAIYLSQGQQNQQPGARPGIVFENTIIGTLSADSNFLYAIEDLQVPPPTNLENDGRFPGGGRNAAGVSSDVSDAIQHNRLQAFEIANGSFKLKWEMGAPERQDGMADCYFLGPPLPLGGKIYVLTERQQELRLVCIDPTYVDPVTKNVAKVVATQKLADTRDKIQTDISRRTQAAHLAYSEGILVCPTNAGAVFGVDLLSNSFVWSYPYHEKTDIQDKMPEGFRGRGRFMLPNSNDLQWKASTPVIVDGKVVFTAPDSRTLHCINLRDGAPIWKVACSKDDQYLAGVFGNRALIVGKKSVRAVDLATGGPLWTVETGIPSGQGVASENIYYLPLKEACQGKEPEICAIDFEKGQIHSHIKSTMSEKGLVVPGNLLFYEGDVISQSATEVLVFPQMDVKRAEINGLLAKNPNDPVGLTELGVVDLYTGNLQNAVDNLLKALANKPPAETEVRARDKLFETLTEYLQNDFDKAEQYIPQYKEMCKIVVPADADETQRTAAEAEERRRTANFLCLVAKGKEAQGKLVEAFEYYRQIGSVAGVQEFVSIVDEPSVRVSPDVWSQGRIEAMLNNAGPESRKPLEKLLADRWEKVRTKNDTEELKKFVAVFGSLSAIGKEARLALADRLIDSDDPKAMLEAERQLSLLRDPDESPALAARTIECLARLYTRQNLLEDAAYFYHVLNACYPNEKVRDGKTGADLYNDLAADKRFLPLLSGAGNTTLSGKVRAEDDRSGSTFNQQQTYVFEQHGERLPFFYTRRLALHGNQLELIDRVTGNEVHWPGSPLPETQFNSIVRQSTGQPNVANFGYQTLGHLIVLPLGSMVFGLDPIQKQVLWSRDLVGSPGSGTSARMQAQIQQGQWLQLAVDPRDGTVEIIYLDGWRQRLGQTGPLGGNTVCVQTREALLALNPVTGQIAWTRSDIDPGSSIFGDGNILFVIGPDNGGSRTTKAMRASDGVSIRVPDFAALYQKRLRVLGNKLLVSDNDAKGQPTLRLYDVRTGKDLWKETFATNSKILQSENPNLAGAIEPSGRVRVFDLQPDKGSYKEVLDTKLYDPHHLDKATSVHLLSDDRYFYIACNEPLNLPPALRGRGDQQPILMPGSGLQSLSVNGTFYCYKKDGSINWYNPESYETLLLDRFADLPMMIFASRYKSPGVGGNGIQGGCVRAIEKQTGKLVYSNENIPNGMFFHALNVDPQTGRVDFIGNQLKISFLLEGNTTSEGPKTSSGGNTETVTR